MREGMKHLVRPVMLAMMIAALPSALIAATDSHVPAAQQEMKADAHAAPVAEHAPAVDAHGAKAEAGHGDAHASNPLAPEKLKDLFWRLANFLALVVILVKFLASRSWPGSPDGSSRSGRNWTI
jgi:F-type H+-transporting ATPase subunit b